MESVLEKIRQAREAESKPRTDAGITDTVVDGCPVKIRFNSARDSKVMAVIKSMLISSYLDSAFTAQHGGEYV